MDSTKKMIIGLVLVIILVPVAAKIYLQRVVKSPDFKQMVAVGIQDAVLSSLGKRCLTTIATMRLEGLSTIIAENIDLNCEGQKIFFAKSTVKVQAMRIITSGRTKLTVIVDFNRYPQVFVGALQGISFFDLSQLKLATGTLTLTSIPLNILADVWFPGSGLILGIIPTSSVSGTLNATLSEFQLERGLSFQSSGKITQFGLGLQSRGRRANLKLGTVNVSIVMQSGVIKTTRPIEIEFNSPNKPGLMSFSYNTRADDFLMSLEGQNVNRELVGLSFLAGCRKEDIARLNPNLKRKLTFGTRSGVQFCGIR